MTRWDLLKNLMMSKESREAIGKAWPLFFFVIFHAKKDNKFFTNYAELKEGLGESPNTIKKWRDHLVDNKVIKVTKGSVSMSFSMVSPYDSIVTCEQDDITQIKMKSDPATKRIIDKVNAYGNMSLLPIVAELSAKLDKLEKKLETNGQL